MTSEPKASEVLFHTLKEWEKKNGWIGTLLEKYDVEIDLAPRFEHFNFYEDHVTIWDRKEKRLVDVYFRNRRVYCEFCKEFDCEHISFALSLPKVVKPLRDIGWIIKDGKVVRGPP